MSQTIKAIKEHLTGEVDPKFLAELAQDERKGVKKLLEQYQRCLVKEKQEEARYESLFFFEREAHQKGYQLIAGIDEVGRGPLAGPVVAAAVILPKEVSLLGLNDSKQLSLAERKRLFDEISKQALAIGIGVVSPEEIDKINIYEATKVAMQSAVEQLSLSPEFLLVDAMPLKEIKLPQLAIIKGDAKSISIAAASVIAKVTRDKMMADYDKEYPGYGFAKNAGYGTKEHLEGLASNGVTPIHRKTFAPIKEMI